MVKLGKLELHMHQISGVDFPGAIFLAGQPDWWRGASGEWFVRAPGDSLLKVTLDAGHSN